MSVVIQLKSSPEQKNTSVTQLRICRKSKCKMNFHVFNDMVKAQFHIFCYLNLFLCLFIENLFTFRFVTSLQKYELICVFRLILVTSRYLLLTSNLSSSIKVEIIHVVTQYTYPHLCDSMKYVFLFNSHAISLLCYSLQKKPTACS